MPTSYRFASWVPNEIRSWARELNVVPDPRGRSDRPLLAQMLSSDATSLLRNGQAFIRQFKKEPDWQEKLENFLLEVSNRSIRGPATDLTPAEAVAKMQKVIGAAKSLAQTIKAHSHLFIRDTLGSIYLNSAPEPMDASEMNSFMLPVADKGALTISEILDAFAEATSHDLEFRRHAHVKEDVLDSEGQLKNRGGPPLGRSDGDCAPRNSEIRHISNLAYLHLGGPYSSFCAAIASIVIGSPKGISLSTYKDNAVPTVPKGPVS